MLVIGEEQVRKLLTPDKCIEVMKETFMALEEGKCAMPQRLICTMPNTAAFGFMPAYVGDYFGAKVIAAYEPNMGTKYPSHIGYVMLFESEHCTVCGMIEAGSITEIRTGCVSAVATDLLSRKYAHKLAVIGAGAQARSHLAAIRLVREITEVMVYDRNPEASRKYAADYTPSCRKESGEYLIPLKEGLISEEHIIGSVGELLLGKVQGRQSDRDITVFDALGLAVEDVASAKMVYGLIV